MKRLTGYDTVAGVPYADLLVGVTEQEVASKLAAYEDAEEQGRLVKLPCKVGDTIDLPTEIMGCYIGNATYTVTGISLKCVADMGCATQERTITLEAAEAALKKMEKGNEYNAK